MMNIHMATAIATSCQSDFSLFPENSTSPPGNGKTSEAPCQLSVAGVNASVPLLFALTAGLFRRFLSRAALAFPLAPLRFHEFQAVFGKLHFGFEHLPPDFRRRGDVG